MRLKRIISVGFVVFSILTNAGFAHTQTNGGIKLNISLDKDIYSTREPVWIEISAFNITDTNIVVLPLVPHCRNCIQIVLKDSQNKELRYVGDIAHYAPGSPHGILLKQNKPYKSIYNLLEGFGEKVNNWALRHFLKPGKYTVQVLYKHRVSSNILEFKVEAPQGDEEKAFQILAEGINHLYKKERDKLVRKLQELVKKYPKSVYADLAYYEMTYWDSNKERAKKTAKELILKHPDSKYTRNAFWELIRGEKKENKKKILKEWISKLPGTKAEGYAKQTLEALERKEE